MNPDPDKLKGVPVWLRPLLGDASGITITDTDLDEAARIAREGARAYRESVVIPFVRPQVETAMAAAAELLAVAETKDQRRFPVLLAEDVGASGEVRYTPAGFADLTEKPIEADNGEIFGVWQWQPEGSGVGFEGLVAVVVEREGGEECGRGMLRKTAQGWEITIDQGNMDRLSRATGDRNQIFLLA